MSVKALLSAVAAGIAMGMLMAPEKGTDTRKKLGEGLDKLKDKWEELKAVVKDLSAEDLKELRDIFKKNVDGLSDDVRQKILKIIESSKAAKEDITTEPV
jgi:gas vesicle protein